MSAKLNHFNKLERAVKEINLAEELLTKLYVESEDMAMSMACAAIEAGIKHLEKREKDLEERSWN
jgi:hypothetical protein